MAQNFLERGGMFINHPRPKKSILPTFVKKRKVVHGVEAIDFDHDARSEYLTGFHKRRLQRVKRAQEENAVKDKEEKLQARKQIREGRKKEVEEHVDHINQLLREAARAGNVSDQEDSDGAGEWEGLPDGPTDQALDQEDEYIDEDKYTSVTIESVSVSRDGLHKPEEEPDTDEEVERLQKEAAAKSGKEPATHPRKEKKKKFRYETKMDRSITARKQKLKKMKQRE